MYIEISEHFTLDEHGFEGNYFGYSIDTNAPNLKNWLASEINDNGFVYDTIKSNISEIFILKNVNVDEQYQGRGHGKSILEQIQDKVDMPIILLCDIAENQRKFFKLENFYLQQGFETILTVKNYPLMLLADDTAYNIQQTLIPHQDKIHVQEWLNADSLDYVEFKISQEPIEPFIKDIKQSIEFEYDEDRERTNIIKEKIMNNEEHWPLYVQKNDVENFVMEGRHRMIAYYELGFDKIPVARVSI